MGLGKSPEAFWLLGEEGREDMNFLVDSESNCDTDKLLIDPQEDRIRSVEVMNFINGFVHHIGFRF